MRAYHWHSHAKITDVEYRRDLCAIYTGYGVFRRVIEVYERGE